MVTETVSERIRQYHEKYHLDQQDATPLTVDPDLLNIRRRLDEEESREVDEEWAAVVYTASVRDTFPAPALAAVARLLHELADRTIVAYGTARRLGVELDDVIRAVMDANMSKVPNPDPAGKARKPEGFVSAYERVLELVKGAEAGLPPLPPKWSAPLTGGVADPFAAPSTVDGAGPVFTAVYNTECPGCDGSTLDDECRMYQGDAWHVPCLDEELGA